jgi:hypothetical protein
MEIMAARAQYYTHCIQAKQPKPAGKIPFFRKFAAEVWREVTIAGQRAKHVRIPLR